MFLHPAPASFGACSHVCMCASKFVNCEFSFTGALIKDPTVSSRHHTARVSLYNPDTKKIGILCKTQINQTQNECIYTKTINMIV